MTTPAHSRRLAAIVAADVAGYSRLMRADEEATLKAIRDLRERVVDPAVETHSGRVVKTMGDGLLIAFDSIVEAIRCCIRVQSDLKVRNADLDPSRRIVLRVGINVGDIIDQDGDVFGDAVNIAARLEGIADPGGICLSEAALQHAGARLEMQTEDMGNQALKNIDEPVRAFRIRAVDSSHPKTGPRLENAAPESSKCIAYELSSRQPALAILPFRNLGGTDENAFVADGISLGIQTLLVQLPNMFFVNACNHQAYRNGAVSAAEALADVAVKFAVEGWVQQAGGRVRVNVQVSRLEDGGILWASTYDRTLDDVFALQDEIARSIAAALSVELIGGHLAHDFTGDLTGTGAWEHFLRGINHFYRMTRSGHMKAVPHFEALADTHPESALGPCYLSVLHYYASQHNWGGPPDVQLALAEKWARKAIPVEVGNNGLGHAVLGAILLARKQHDEALSLCHAAVAFRAGCPFANSQLGVTQTYMGDLDSGLRNIRAAIGARAFGPAPAELNALAIAYRDRGDLDLSITAAEECARIEPDFTDGLVTLASDFVMNGQSDRAKEAAREILQRQPGFSIDQFLLDQPYTVSDIPQKIAAALQKAGLPE